MTLPGEEESFHTLFWSSNVHYTYLYICTHTRVYTAAFYFYAVFEFSQNDVTLYTRRVHINDRPCLILKKKKEKEKNHLNSVDEYKRIFMYFNYRLLKYYTSNKRAHAGELIFNRIHAACVEISLWGTRVSRRYITVIII